MGTEFVGTDCAVADIVTSMSSKEKRKKITSEPITMENPKRTEDSRWNLGTDCYSTGEIP